MAAAESVRCPVCFKDFTNEDINGHLDACLLEGASDCSPSSTVETGPPEAKKCRTGADPVNQPGSSSSSSMADSQSSVVFSLFQTNKGKLSAREPSDGVSSQQNSPTAPALNRGLKRPLRETSRTPQRSQLPDAGISKAPMEPLLSRALFASNKPLAEALRPNTLEEYFGQSKAVGQQTLLRSLLESQEIPSVILWGPPGCGKVRAGAVHAGPAALHVNHHFLYNSFIIYFRHANMSLCGVQGSSNIPISVF